MIPLGPSEVVLKCGWCGDQFLVLDRRRDRRFCGWTCRYKHNHRASIDPCQICGKVHRKGQWRCELRSLKTCPQCGEQFLARRQAQFCSRHCANQFDGRERERARRYYWRHHPTGSSVRKCVICGENFRNRMNYLSCSYLCGYKLKRIKWQKADQRRYAAVKIYREMGFSAEWTDGTAIYKALKAELPTLNI